MALAAPVARPGVLLHDAPRPLPGRPDPEDLARVPVPAQRAAGRADPPLPATSGTGLSFGGARTPPFPSPVIIVVSGPPNAVAPRPGEEDAWSPGGMPPSREAPPRHPASGMVNAATTSSKAVARARPPDRPAAVTPTRDAREAGHLCTATYNKGGRDLPRGLVTERGNVCATARAALRRPRLRASRSRIPRAPGRGFSRRWRG